MTADSELLQAAVTEVARLLEADGAMIYLVDEASGTLRSAHDAGISDPEAQRLIRDLVLPVGVGMFGSAVASGRLTVTDDYPADRRFTHSPVADRIVAAAGMRSMAVAPLISGGRPIGAMGAYSRRPAAFTEAGIALLRALANHAATAIANQRLLGQLAASEARYRNLVEGSPDVVWATDAGGRFTFLSETVEQMTGRRAEDLIGEHWSVIVAPEDREGFEARWRAAQEEGDAERRARFRVERVAGPKIIVELRGRERLVDGRSAGAHGSVRDITDLDRLERELRTHADELALRVETQQTLHAIAARITAIRDPDEVLQHVVDAAQRLLVSDGAHLTLRDPERPVLRPHVMAGGMDEATRAWMAGLEFPIGGGMNGVAAGDGMPAWTHDYLTEPRIQPHTENDLAVAARMGLRAMAVAPLRAPDGEVFGTLAISYEEPRDIRPDEIELLQGLADIGSIAIANARLYEQVTRSGEDLRRQAEELARLVDVQRTLGEIARRIAEVDDPAQTLQQVVDASKRLLGSDGAHLTLMDDDGRNLVPMVLAGDTDPETRTWLHAQRFPVGGGINGLAAQSGTPMWTDDYAADPRIPHDPTDDSPTRLELGAVAVAPLRGARGEVIGTLAITYRRPRAVDPRDVALLEELAGQGAVAARNADLWANLRKQADALAHSVEAQRTLATLAAEISTIRDPGAVLRRTVDAAQRLMAADHAVINQLEQGTDQLYDLSPDDLSLVPGSRLAKGAGVAGAAIAEVRVRWTGDYLADASIVHVPEADAWMRDHGFRSQMSAPLIIDDEPMGTLTVHAARPDAFGEEDAELLGALAAHAAIVQTNARLYAESQRAADELGKLVEAQRSLASIATQISALRDPAVILQRTVDEAHRLLGADLALVNPLATSASGTRLEWAVAHAPANVALDDVVVEPGRGVSGTALAEGRVVRTGRYLDDPAFPHTPDLDAYVGRRGMRSVMSAPLVTGDEPIGTLTVQASRAEAFDEDDAHLLGALAAQAAVAITNARLLEQLQQSERNYRHLVDHSPDLVWAVDAEGNFTYLGEALERMTGRRIDELLGRHWGNLITPESLRAGQAAWQAIQDRPDEELQLRVELPLAGGGTMAAEVNLVATMIDGRFAGAQGSIRDIRERERLDEDLRRQAAAIAANEERANLARELHDSVTQALFSMGLTARALEMLLDRDPAAARQKLVELRELQKDALAEMRTLIFELRPQGLETDGLAQALRNHAAAVQGRTGLAVSAEVEHEERLPAEVEEALYRIAQEALHNVVKHANAQRARIALRLAGRVLRLEVEDDGVGFDPGLAPRGHLGLVGMRQRAERLGGELDIARRPGGGARVRVSVPLARLGAEPVAAASAE